MSLQRLAIALLVAVCGLTLAASQTPHAPRQLLAAQSFGSVVTPKTPTMSRKHWGPKPDESTPGRHLLAAQSFGSVETPKQPKAATRVEWGPKFASLGGGNKKLLAFLAPQQPKKPADVKASRFAPKATSASTTDSPGRKLQAVQAVGATQAPKLPNAVARKDWGPRFPAASAAGDRK